MIIFCEILLPSLNLNAMQCIEFKCNEFKCSRLNSNAMTLKGPIVISVDLTV